MFKYFQIILTLFALSFYSHVNASNSDADDNSHKQKSSLFASVPGDPNFRIDPDPIKRTKAVLIRKEDRLMLTVKSRGLPSGAYTVWMRVFNRPDLCSGGEGVNRSVCSRGSDLAAGVDPSVPGEDGLSTSSVFWIASSIVGDDGVAHISTSVDINTWPGMVLLGTDVRGTEKQAVWNAFGSEVHIVLRYHGPAAVAEGPTFLRDPLTGEFNAITEAEESAFFELGRQLTRVLGSCSPLPPFFEDPSNCSDEQLAIFPAIKYSSHEHHADESD